MGRPSRPLKIRHLMVVIAVIAVILAFDSLPGGWACGEYELIVNLKGPSGRKVVVVAAGSTGSLEQAGDYLLNTPEPLANVEPVAWVPGEPFGVRVPCGAQISALSMRRMHPWQYRAVILRVDYDDGMRQFLAWEIPDRSHARKVTLTIPDASRTPHPGVVMTASVPAF